MCIQVAMAQGAGGLLAGLQAILSEGAFKIMASGNFKNILTYTAGDYRLNLLLATDFDDLPQKFRNAADQWVLKYLPAQAYKMQPADVGQWYPAIDQYWETFTIEGDWY